MTSEQKNTPLSSSGPGYFIPKDARAGKKVSAITEKPSDDRICTQNIAKDPSKKHMGKSHETFTKLT